MPRPTLKGTTHERSIWPWATSPDFAGTGPIFSLSTSPDFAPTSPGEVAEPVDFAPQEVYPRRGYLPGRGQAAAPRRAARSARHSGEVPGVTRRQHPAAHLDSRNPRGVRAKWCQCGQPVIRGLNDDDAAWVVTCDPGPLTPLGEAIARIQGRGTFELRRVNGTYQLLRRDRLTIRSRPPGERIWCGNIDVIAEHACYSFPLPTQPSVHQPEPPTRESNDDRPPF